MSRLLPYEGLLRNLRGEIEEGRREFLTKEQALERLRELSGEDFGDDPAAWEEWVKSRGLK